MDPVVITLSWLAVVALIAVGIAGAVLPALPGVPLVFVGLWLAAWIDGYARVGSGTLVVLGVLTALALLIDFVASALGAKRVGASPKAVTGAVLGSLVGLFFGLPGIILGPFVGAVLGELATQRNFDHATRVGIATWMGLLFGTIAKLVTSLVMVGIFVFAYFW
ncbi:DUF456 domain-containing protein [Sinimarinibacterium thermocellulolyticum]|uniref:DUF456 family protein n=1 Tax=Sinimarinibacterium thermocellulolyticum TaxID=3170016 RepID=A0ABV2A7I8_9GAMM